MTDLTFEEKYANFTVDQVVREMNSLRGANENLADAINAQQKLLRQLREEERRRREEFEEQMRIHLERQSSVSQTANQILSKVDGNKLTIEKLQKLMARLLQEQQDAEKQAAMEAELEEFLANVPAWGKAADFQKQDVLETYKAYKNGLNGFANFNDMGLGKTLEAILSLNLLQQDFLKEHARAPRILWLTKKSLIVPTVYEFQMWDPNQRVFPLNFMTTSAQERSQMFKLGMATNSIIIANYEIMNTTEEIRATEWDFIVIDEVHRLKGGANKPPTAIWKRALAISRKSRFLLVLSGTPMVNHPKEMWSYLHIFDPERFPSLNMFESMFGSKHVIKGLVISADLLLKNALMGQAIRRRRDEVGIQLPELVHNYRYLEMGPTQRAVYDQMKQNFFVWLGGQEDGKPLSAAAIIARLNRLRQINVWAKSIKKKMVFEDGHEEEMTIDCDESSKIDEAMELIRNLQAEGEQVVVFCTFNEPLAEIRRRCTAAVVDSETGDKTSRISCEIVRGENSDKVAQYADDFQQKKLDVLCINLAMSEGMNLQKNADRWPGGASHAIFLDLWWTPARNEQAEARIHRQGAKDNCQIHILYNEESIDQFMASKLEEKSAQFANILERQEIRPASEWKKILGELL